MEGPRRAVVTFKGVDVQGKVLLEQASISSPVKIRGAIYGLEPGQHSIDIHQGSVLGERCDSIGPQFAVEGENERPVAYLGNVKVSISTIFKKYFRWWQNCEKIHENTSEPAEHETIF